ncbi:MAG: hypothetical protein WBC33_13200 [Conexibacter sp.]
MTPLAFLHVPKCAGSSVIRALETAFPPGARAPQFFEAVTFGADADHAALPRAMRAAIAVDEQELAALASYTLVCGHFTLPSLLRITSAPRIATVLREPRARLLSLYAYWATGDFPLLAGYARHRHAERSFAEFLAEPAIVSVVDNQLCRLVLHGDPRIPADGFIDAAAAAALGADAIAQLERIGFVGIQERPDTLWSGLSSAFGVRVAPVHVNATGDLPGAPRFPPLEQSLDAAALALLLRRTAVDRLVYRHFAGRDPEVAHAPDLFEDAALARHLLALGALASRSAGSAS